MPEYTIITTTHTVTVAGDHWARDPDGDVYVYPENGDTDPVAEVDAEEFVGIVTGDVDITALDRQPAATEEED
jgi:hypothetical protein